ncbi:MAG TPA: 50S ribosomal protein L9 [Deltaproteobacteria bacterium]|nr:MAG: 50S ribosomal protein L9 [Deltaproteobacteria bacterium GWA2_45_12]HBF12710.1 50S ribosomal protein L9 [Deltaproteobacteria bacterium]
MQVVLRETINGLGFVGDIINVKPGYYRNYLAPRSIAFLANPGSIRELEHQKRVIEVKKGKEKELALKFKEKLEADQISIVHNAGSGDKLFGSINTQEIVAHLKEKGFVVDRRLMALEAPIKTLGVHIVNVKLHPEVVANVKVEVVKKEEETKEKH